MTQALISRRDAVALIELHLNGTKERRMIATGKPEEAFCWHYGRCELNALLDAIYGKTSDDTEILGPKR